MKPTDPAAPKTDYLTLDNLGAGAAKELFQHELEKVLENILDPNTDAKCKRTVVLTVTIVPGDNRDECATLIEATSKLAPFKGAGCTLFVGRKDGIAVATQYDSKQLRLGFDGAAGPVVVREPERVSVAK